MRYAPNGKPVTSFSVPVDVGTKEKPKTIWHRCTAWAKAAEVIAQYFKKGDWIEIEGIVDASAFSDREGNPKASLEVTVREFHFGPKAGGNKVSEEAPVDSGAPVDPDDLPF